MDFGRHIRELRKSKNLSLREAARRSNMSHPYLSQIETGKNTNPTPNIIKKLSAGLNVPYMQLMEMAGYTDYYDTIAESSWSDTLLDNNSRDLYFLLKDDHSLYYNRSLLSGDDKEFLLTILERTFRNTN